MSDTTKDDIIEDEYKRILKELRGSTLLGRPIDPFNHKHLIVAAWFAGYYQYNPFCKKY